MYGKYGKHSEKLKHLWKRFCKNKTPSVDKIQWRGGESYPRKLFWNKTPFAEKQVPIERASNVSETTELSLQSSIRKVTPRNLRAVLLQYHCHRLQTHLLLIIDNKNNKYCFCNIIITTIMKFTHIMGTPFTKLRLFSRKVFHKQYFFFFFRFA